MTEALVAIALTSVLGLLGFFLNRTLRSVETALKELKDEVHQWSARVRDLEEARRDHDRRLAAVERRPLGPQGSLAPAP